MRIILTILGLISLVLGCIGIVVPLLPTTPFLLLSAAIFIKTSPKLYAWLMKSPTLGEYITNYRENRSISLRAKCTSVSLLWISILYCTICVARGMIYLQALLILVAIGVTWHLLSLKTAPRRRRSK